VSAEAREASFGLCSTVRELWAIRRAQDAAAAAVVREVRRLTPALSEARLKQPGARGMKFSVRRKSDADQWNNESVPRQAARLQLKREPLAVRHRQTSIPNPILWFTGGNTSGFCGIISVTDRLDPAASRGPFEGLAGSKPLGREALGLASLLRWAVPHLASCL
jgi:hypothetical protein